MVLDRTAVYLALFSLTLLAVIAGSGAVMVMAGKGQAVMFFALGIATGLSLGLALSLKRWQVSRAHLTAMKQEILKAMATLQRGEINPRGLLAQATPSHGSDIHLEIHLEIECRRLLDRTKQLLEKVVREDGYCHCCKQWNAHDAQCPVPAAQQLYEGGKAKRVPWQTYRKTLPQDVI